MSHKTWLKRQCVHQSLASPIILVKPSLPGHIPWACKLERGSIPSVGIPPIRQSAAANPHGNPMRWRFILPQIISRGLTTGRLWRLFIPPRPLLPQAPTGREDAHTPGRALRSARQAGWTSTRNTARTSALLHETRAPGLCARRA